MIREQVTNDSSCFPLAYGEGAASSRYIVYRTQVRGIDDEVPMGREFADASAQLAYLHRVEDTRDRLRLRDGVEVLLPRTEPYAHGYDSRSEGCEHPLPA